MEAPIENTSGQGGAAVVPPEIDRWNWGAFLLHWIWGIGNRTPIAFLTFVPFVSIVMVFVLGAKGSAWAWRNRQWQSVEHFRRVQRQWAIWGAVIAGGAILLGILFAVSMFALIFSVLKESDAYRLGVSTLNANPQAVAILGAPIATGTPTGKINFDGAEGEATLSFSVTGTKAGGTIDLTATRHHGRWELDREELTVPGRDAPIELVQ